MKNRFPSLVLAALSLPFLLSPSPADTRTSAPPDRLLSGLEELGYDVVNASVVSPCWESWERECFGLKSKRGLFIKRRRSLPGSAAMFPRFVVWEELFDDAGRAEARLAGVNRTPRCAPIEETEKWLAAGFRLGAAAYILSTDALIFEGEMTLLSRRLEERLGRR